MGRGLDGYFVSAPVTVLACSFQASSRPPISQRFGGNSERETPLPIPNRAVKPLSADGTWWATAWESRSPPVFTSGPPGRAVLSRASAFAPPVAATGVPRLDHEPIARLVERDNHELRQVGTKQVIRVLAGATAARRLDRLVRDLLDGPRELRVALPSLVRIRRPAVKGEARIAPQIE